MKLGQSESSDNTIRLDINNKSKIKYSFTWDKWKTIKLLEENAGGNQGDLEFGDDFLNTTLKA